MLQALFGQIAGIFATPMGAFVLVVALLAAVGVLVWGFWRRDEAPVPPAAEITNTQVTPPPLLAPEMMTGGRTKMMPTDHHVRNALLALLAIAALFVVWQFAAKGGSQTVADAETDDLTPIQEALGDALTPAAIPAYTHTDLSRIVCAEGILNDDYPRSYQLCGANQAARFDVIGFARGGQPLIDVAWAPHSGGSSAVMASNQPAPFSLDREGVALVASAGSDINNYDAFLAIGPYEPVKNEAAGEHLSSQRSFDLARFVLASLRGEEEADCQTTARVRAIALDKDVASEQGLEKPVVIGVRFDERYPVADRNLDQLVADFFGSQGAKLAGQSLHEASGYHTLFTETACRGLF